MALLPLHSDLLREAKEVLKVKALGFLHNQKQTVWELTAQRLVL